MSDPDSPLSEQPERPTGRWVKGGPSPNPGGRPRNSSWHQRMRRELQANTPAVLARLHDLAMAGNTDAARLLLSRSLAPARDDPVKLPGMAGSLSDQARGIMAQVAAGTISPSVGVELLQALGTVSRVVEVGELEQRLQAVEAAQAARATHP